MWFGGGDCHASLRVLSNEKEKISKAKEDLG